MGLPGGGAWTAPQQIAIANVSKSPGIAIASLILGIGAFFFSLIPIVGLISIPFAIAGLALGIAGYVRSTKGYEGKGLAITGIIGCTAALLVSIVYLFVIGNAVTRNPPCALIHSDGYAVNNSAGTCYSPVYGYYNP